MEANLPKQLRIKLGSLKRIHKEHYSYQKEEEQQKKKIENMKAKGDDEYSIRKQIEVLQDTQNMLPNCEGRLNDAVGDISSWIDEYGEDASVKDTEQLQEAQEQIVAAREFLEQLKQQSTTKNQSENQVKPDDTSSSQQEADKQES